MNDFSYPTSVFAWSITAFSHPGGIVGTGEAGVV